MFAKLKNKTRNVIVHAQTLAFGASVSLIIYALTIKYNYTLQRKNNE